MQKVAKRQITNFDDYLREQLKDPEFKKTWDESEEEYQKGRKLIISRIRKSKR